MSLLDDLNPAQKEAVLALEGPVMIVAGAGSGKTKVLTYKIAHLLSIGVPSYKILALTFTNKAAGEMNERIQRLAPVAAGQLWMGTFHSVFARILRREAELIGYTRTFSIYDTIDSLNLVKYLVASEALPSHVYAPNAVRSRISLLKNQLVTVDEAEQRASDLFEETTARLYRKYQDQLRQNNAMDFDDLLLKPIELFQRFPDAAKRYRERFQFLFVDEYQDTNRAQYLLLKHLAARFRNICVVGDDAQSIYAFRGADIRNMLEFEKDYPDRKLFRLEQNYRSTRAILKAADTLIKNNIDQIRKDLWTDNEDGDPVTLLACADEVDEARAIVSAMTTDLHRLKLNFRDIAILYRTNAQSRALEEGLRNESIPYVIVGGVEFYQRKEIKDILGYFKVLVNPKDNESFLRIVNTPPRGIGEKALERFREFADSGGMSFAEAAPRANECAGMSEKARKGFSWLAGYITKFRSLQESTSLSELARMMVDDIGILADLKSEGTIEALGRWDNIQELLSGISEFSARNPEGKMEDFLENVALVSDLDSWEDQQNAVTLMTLHAAKGLEFPLVVIAGMEEGLLPFSASHLERKDLEEERRLCYVGMTRAMKKLYLSSARTRFRHGELTTMLPSRFLGEIGDGAEIVARSVSSFSRGEVSRTRRGRWDDVQAKKKEKERYFSDVMPDYENQSDEVQSLGTGMVVTHETFGRGRVVALQGQGESAKVVVDFESVGRKHLMVKYARLTRSS